MTGRRITFGNVTLTDRGSTVELTLNTFVGNGRPCALFTPDSLHKLADVIRGFATAPPDDEVEDIL